MKLKNLYLNIIKNESGAKAVKIVSKIFLIVNIIIQKVFKKNQYLIENKIVLSIGAGDIASAVELFEKEKKQISSERIKFILKIFAFNGHRFKRLCEIEKIFENYIKENDEQLWAWRVLIDINYYNCNYDGVRKNHEKFREVLKKIARKNNINLELNKYFGSYYTYSIGHMCWLAYEIMIKQLEDKEDIEYYLIIDKEKNIAPEFLKYFIPYFKIIDKKEEKNKKEVDLQLFEDPFLYCSFYKNQWSNLYEIEYEVFEKWTNINKRPFLKLSNEDEIFGQEILKKLAITSKDWFVVMHIRGGDGVRKCELNDYEKAMKFIVQNGGWVIRIGNNKMEKLQKSKNVVDLTRTQYNTDRLHIFLYAKCLFSIDTTSGPSAIPRLFGTRSLQTNVIPFLHSITDPRSISLPILYYSKAKKRKLTVKEIINDPISYSEYKIKKNEDIVLIKNSPNDILNATKEMYEICMNGKKFESNNNNKEFKRIVQDSKIPYITEISNEFINNYKEIIK